MNGLATLKDYIKLHIIILIWGTTGILGKLISIPAISIVWYRTLICVVSLLLFIGLKKQEKSIPFKTQIGYIIIGGIVALHWYFFFASLKIAPVSVALVVLSTSTLFTALIEPLIFKRKIIKYEIALGLIVVGGIMLIFTFENKYHLGIIYALISAGCASLFTTANGLFIHKGGNPTKITLYEMGAACILISLYYISSGRIMDPINALLKQDIQIMWLDIIYLLFLGVICTAVSFVVSVELMRKISPFTMTISLNMEPVYAIIIAILIFGNTEYMSSGFYIGTGVIGMTIIANAYIKKNNNKWKGI